MPGRNVVREIYVRRLENALDIIQCQPRQIQFDRNISQFKAANPSRRDDRRCRYSD